MEVVEVIANVAVTAGATRTRGPDCNRMWAAYGRPKYDLLRNHILPAVSRVGEDDDATLIDAFHHAIGNPQGVNEIRSTKLIRLFTAHAGARINDPYIIKRHANVLDPFKPFQDLEEISHTSIGKHLHIDEGTVRSYAATPSPVVADLRNDSRFCCTMINDGIIRSVRNKADTRGFKNGFAAARQDAEMLSQVAASFYGPIGVGELGTIRVP